MCGKMCYFALMAKKKKRIDIRMTDIDPDVFDVICSESKKSIRPIHKEAIWMIGEYIRIKKLSKPK